MKIRCISLWQPWAQWVALGWKKIETRTHNRFASLVGERIAIHAAIKVDGKALAEAERWLSDYQFHQTAYFPSESGVLCTVEVTASRLLTTADESHALIECVTPRHGLFLTDPQPLRRPEIKGRQGIFTIEV